MPPLKTRDLIGVELLSTGGPIHGKGSPPEGDTMTLGDLEAFVNAEKELGTEFAAPLKIGHSRAQRLAKASGLLADDEKPAVGWIKNLRVKADGKGGKLLGDLLNVPAKLADLVESRAFRKRSIEFKTAYTSQATGKQHRNVLTGLALLGAVAPAVKTLDDIVALYGDDQVDDDTERTYDLNDPEPDGGAPTFDVEIRFALDEPGRKRDGRADTGGVPGEITLTETAAKQLAEKLGLEGDVDEAKLLEAVEARERELAEAKEKAEKPPEPKPDDKPRELSDEDRQALEDGKQAARELYEMRRDGVVVKAMSDGRITPAQRAEIETLYDANPEATVKHLAALRPDETLAKAYGSDADGVGPEGRKEQEDKQFAQLADELGIPEEDRI